MASIIVASVVLIGVLALAGVFSPSSGTGPGVVGTPLYYAQAEPLGSSGVANQTGGPWTVVAAEGVGLSASASGSNVAGTLGSGCSASPAPGAPSSTTIPATPSNSNSGAVAAWLFLAAGPSGQLLFYVVTVASDYPLMIVTGSCTSEFSSLVTISGISVVNASGLVASVNAAGGTTFLSENPNSLVALVLFGAGLDGSSDPYWAIEYNSCGTSTSGTGTLFIEGFDASTGTALSSPTTESTNC